MKTDIDIESATHSLAVLPARPEHLKFVIGQLNDFRALYSKRQSSRDADLAEARHILASGEQQSPRHRVADEDLAPSLAQLVQQTAKQARDVDSLFDAAEARSQQALPLSKSMFDSIRRLDCWMTSAEGIVEQIPTTPVAVDDESDCLRRLQSNAKAGVFLKINIIVRPSCK